MYLYLDQEIRPHSFPFFGCTVIGVLLRRAWTIGGSLFLGPRGWTSIRAVVHPFAAIFFSMFLKKRGGLLFGSCFFFGGLLFGHGTNKEGGLLSGGVNAFNPNTTTYLRKTLFAKFCTLTLSLS